MALPEYVYKEIPVGFVQDKGEFQSLYSQDDQQILELREKLIEIIFEKVEELTEKQKRVLKAIYVDKLTQVEAGYKLGIHQTTIHNSLFGSRRYNDRGSSRVYGGSINKLKKLVLNDPEVNYILRAIKERGKELVEDLPVTI